MKVVPRIRVIPPKSVKLLVQSKYTQTRVIGTRNLAQSERGHHLLSQVLDSQGSGCKGVDREKEEEEKRRVRTRMVVRERRRTRDEEPLAEDCRSSGRTGLAENILSIDRSKLDWNLV